MARTRTTTGLVIVIAIAMLTMTMPALASHNSHGTHVGVVVPDGVDDEGEPIPKTNPDLEASYHEGAAEDGLIPAPRPAPQDQRGDRYTDCTTAAEAGELYDPANNEDHCYVGYLDSKRLWLAALNLFLVRQSSDLLYGFNPSADDGYCRGQDAAGDEDQRIAPVTGVEPVDQAVANAERVYVPGVGIPFTSLSVGDVGDQECSGSGHTTFTQGDVLIDTALIEAPFQDDNFSPGLSDGQANNPRTIPLLTKPYALLFGQPHPDNENPSTLEAGEGPFAGFPGSPEQGTPSAFLGDLSGVCGDRTNECKLLTPDDLMLYDRHRPDIEGDSEQARFCEFSPQFGTINPDGRQAGLCGLSGNTMNQFLPETRAGGLDIEDGPSTWLNMLPGWYRGVISISWPSVSNAISFGTSYLDDDTDYTKGYHFYYAVNPKVPTGEHPLWCAVPNMLATGEGFGDVGASLDPGLYGTFEVDAIAYNLHPVAYHEAQATVHDATHQPVRDALGPLQALADDAQGEAEQVLEDLEDTGVDVPPEIDEALDRSNPATPDWEKPYNEPDATQDDFDIQLDEGIACNPAGQPELTEAKTFDGGLLFDTDISQETVSFRDMTVFDDEDLPKRQSEADHGTWQTDLYTFSGLVKGIVDTAETGAFVNCPTLDGTTPTNASTCVWESYWDVYNPNCNTFLGDDCLQQTASLGYAPNASADDPEQDGPLWQEEDPANGIGGVGLFFALEVTGPVVVMDSTTTDPNRLQERTQILGTEDPTATHCVIGTSIGLEPFLLEHLGSDEDTGWTDAIVDTFCPDADGETYIAPDGFGNQGSTARGQFSGAIAWGPLVPSADATSNALGGFGDDDRLCVGGLWSVQANLEDATVPTRDNLEHTSERATINYGECLDLSTTSSNNHAWQIL